MVVWRVSRKAPSRDSMQFPGRAVLANRVRAAGINPISARFRCVQGRPSTDFPTRTRDRSRATGKLSAARAGESPGDCGRPVRFDARLHGRAGRARLSPGFPYFDRCPASTGTVGGDAAPVHPASETTPMACGGGIELRGPGANCADAVLGAGSGGRRRRRPGASTVSPTTPRSRARPLPARRRPARASAGSGHRLRSRQRSRPPVGPAARPRRCRCAC